jgi:hypothetical protein
MSQDAEHPDGKSQPPLAYPFETILTTEQLAEWLQVSARHVEELELPALVRIGRVKRYCAGIVLQHLTGSADAPSIQWPQRR